MAPEVVDAYCQDSCGVSRPDSWDGLKVRVVGVGRKALVDRDVELRFRSVIRNNSGSAVAT